MKVTRKGNLNLTQTKNSKLSRKSSKISNRPYTKATKQSNKDPFTTQPPYSKVMAKYIDSKAPLKHNKTNPLTIDLVVDRIVGYLDEKSILSSRMINKQFFESITRIHKRGITTMVKFENDHPIEVERMISMIEAYRSEFPPLYKSISINLKAISIKTLHLIKRIIKYVFPMLIQLKIVQESIYRIKNKRDLEAFELLRDILDLGELQKLELSISLQSYRIEGTKKRGLAKHMVGILPNMCRHAPKLNHIEFNCLDSHHILYYDYFTAQEIIGCLQLTPPQIEEVNIQIPLAEFDIAALHGIGFNTEHLTLVFHWAGHGVSMQIQPLPMFFQDEVDRPVPAVYDLLSRLAPNLKHLTLNGILGSQLDQFVKIQFPQLDHLTILGMGNNNNLNEFNKKYNNGILQVCNYRKTFLYKGN